jgi:hypothetical protein
MGTRGWLLAALLIAALGCGNSGSTPTDGGATADACPGLREQWGAMVGALSNTCSTVADCLVVGGSNGCSGGESIAPDLVGSIGCWGLPANVAAYAASAEANDLAARLEASCTRVSFDCLQADPLCQNGVCVLSTDCKCLCARDGGATD